MKVMVTGADGVLGSNLVRILLDRGHVVRVLQLTGTTSPTLEGLPIEQRQGNILDPSSVEACMEGMEAVIHCAASTQVFPAKNDFIRRVNVEGTNNIADACLKLNVQRMVYVGTANSFGTEPHAPELADERATTRVTCTGWTTWIPSRKPKSSCSVAWPRTASPHCRQPHLRDWRLRLQAQFRSNDHRPARG